MLKISLIILLVLVVGKVVKTMHLHPHSRQISEQDVPIDQREENTNKDSVADIDGMSIDVIRHIKPSRFVPVNNALFFESYPPCEKGFQRDLFGMCREVW